MDIYSNILPKFGENFRKSKKYAFLRVMFAEPPDHGRSQDFFSGGGETIFQKILKKIFKKFSKNIQKNSKNLKNIEKISKNIQIISKIIK